jgi:chitodextrinase
MDSFRISWQASSDNISVAGYDIYLDSVLYAATGVDTSILITGLKPSVTYQVMVVAKDGSENFSAFSSPLSVVTLPDTQAPTVPGGLSSQFVVDNGFLLKWNASTDNNGMSGYDVYKDGVFYKYTTAMRLNIGGLSPGTSYTMTVVARDIAGNASEPSLPLIVKTTGIATGIESPASSEWEILISQNPATRELLHISLKNFPDNKDVFVAVSDLKGTEFYKSNMFGSRNFTIPVNSGRTGIYLVRITCGATKITKKVLISE